MQITVNSITRANGRVKIKYNGKRELDLPARDLAQWLRDTDEDEQLALRLILAYVFHRSNDLSDVTSIVGKTVTFSLSAANPFRVT